MRHLIKYINIIALSGYIKKFYLIYQYFWQKIGKQKTKKKTIIDIQGLNNMIILDAYFIFLQNKIINNFQKCN